MTLQAQKPTEHEEQARLISWATASALVQTDPLKRDALERFHAIPNGAAVQRNEDARNPGSKQGGTLNP
jgi:hypothetical protein